MSKRATIKLFATIAGFVGLTATAFAQPPGAPPGMEPNFRDIAYAPAEPAGSRGHLLDLYLPSEGNGPYPVVIFTGGSAWFSDDTKTAAGWIAPHLVPEGFAVAGVSIRASTQAKFPAQVHDIKAAIRWLRENAEDYNLDPDRIAMMGDSSGGWTTAMAAVTGDISTLEGDIGVTGQSSALQAAVAFYPPTDFLQMGFWANKPCRDDVSVQEGFMTGEFCHTGPDTPESILLDCPIEDCPDKVANANPLTYVTPNDPPMMILHGRNDLLVAHNQGERLYMALNKACVTSVFVSLPLAGHGPVQGFLGDDTLRSGATVTKTTKGNPCNVEATRLQTPDWAMVVDFLRSSMGQ